MCENFTRDGSFHKRSLCLWNPNVLPGGHDWKSKLERQLFCLCAWGEGGVSGGCVLESCRKFWLVNRDTIYVLCWAQNLRKKPLSESGDVAGLTEESDPWVTQMSVYEDWFVDKWTKCDFTSKTELFFLKHFTHLRVVPNLWTDKTDFLLWNTKVDRFFVRTIKVIGAHWQNFFIFQNILFFCSTEEHKASFVLFLYPCAVLNIIQFICCSLSKWPAF